MIGLDKNETSIFEKVWYFLNSMRVGLMLLVILTIISAYAATFLEPMEAMRRVYSSWWFIALLAMIAASLTVCSINRFPSIMKQIKVNKSDASEKYLNSLENKEEIVTTSTFDSLEAVLRRKGYRTSVSRTDGQVLISAAKGRFGYMGSLLTHVSLVLILAAGFYGVNWGSEDTAVGFAGDLLKFPQYGFDVRINDFRIAYRDDKSIEQYYSTLTVIENGQEVKQETIFVNRPLRHQGVVLYQSLYGWGVDVKFTNSKTGQTEEMLLVPGQSGFNQNLGIGVNILRIFPDFTMTQDGVPASKTSYPEYLVVEFQFIDHHGRPIGDQFYLEPLGKELRLSEEISVEFISFDNFTGLQATQQPGKILALVASILVCIGLFLCFYLYPRRIWISQSDSRKDAILVAGVSYRNKGGFGLEFEQIADELNALGSGE